MTPLKLIEEFLDGVTMYRAVLYALVVLVISAFGLSVVDIFVYTPLELLVSLGVTTATALIVNKVFALLFKVPTNYESALITGGIIYFLFLPTIFVLELLVIALATALAVASKYILAWRKQHIVNPAAFGAFTVALLGFDPALWWVGSPLLFIPMLIVGVLVVMKVRKWTPVLSFVVVGFLVYSVEAVQFGLNPITEAPAYFLSWPTLFLATIMLTEPFTMPPTKRLQCVYGGLVGVLSSTTLLSPVIAMTPELALIVGNIAMYPFTLRQKLYLTLIETKTIAANTLEFVFQKPKGLYFKAGQYLEWTLGHESPDKRGIRRYFTIASSPTEGTVNLAARFVEQGSSYKDALETFKPGDVIVASQLAGDFMLPKDDSVKCALVAGGIGVTPFRSHIKEWLDTDSSRPLDLYYCNNVEADIAYRALFETANEREHFSLIHVLSKEEVVGMEHGYITADMIKQHTPDWQERVWYLSGPPPMVYAYTALLREMGLPRGQIVRDFFPGLA